MPDSHPLHKQTLICPVTRQLPPEQNFFFFFLAVVFPWRLFDSCCVVFISRGRALGEDKEEIWVKTSSGIRDSPFDPAAH